MLPTSPLPRRALRTVSVAALSFLATSACRSVATPQQADFAAIDRLLEEQRATLHLPGLAFAVVADDRIAHITTLGLRDVEHNLPVTEDTLFPIGSCTKAFTSMAVALAADRHLLTLDDHPQQFLPYFHMADPVADANVTLRDMLCHRTGLKAYADLAAEPGVLNREEYVRAATSAKPVAPFRSKFQYSNAMYSAIGEIVGRAFGSTWEHAIEQQIFAPLKMTSSTTSALRADTVTNHATGYIYDAQSQSFHPVPPPRSLDALAPGGNVASTLRDMTQWLRMLASGGRYEGRKFVSAAMLRELTTPQIAISPTTSYALGWATYQWNGWKVVEHNGGSEGLSALVSFIPERHLGFVFLANTSPNAMTKVNSAAARIYALLLPGVRQGPNAASTVTPSSSKDIVLPLTTNLPDIDSLFAQMIASAGGEATLRRHTSLVVHSQKTYDNQGVTADYTIEQYAPAKRNEVEEWSAAGKHIATVRVYFDGTTGGQKTTFGQNATNGPEENRRAREDATMHPLLDWKTLYPKASVTGATTIDATPVWVVELTPEHDSPTTWYVAQNNARIVKRERDGESMTFSDYRNVDGEFLPFRIVINDPLGETTIVVQTARYGE